MKLPFLLSLSVLTVALAGCTDGDLDAPRYTGPKAELWHSDVPVDGMKQDWVDCGDATHIYVEYRADDEEPQGDFTVNVRSESSQLPYDENGRGGIPIFPSSDDPQHFSGFENGTFEQDLAGTAGTWLLEVHRSQFHNGQFIVRLICAE